MRRSRAWNLGRIPMNQRVVAKKYRRLQCTRRYSTRQEHGAFVANSGDVSLTIFRLGRRCADWQLRSAQLTSDESALCEFVYLLIREAGKARMIVSAILRLCSQRTHPDLETRGDPR